MKRRAISDRARLRSILFILHDGKDWREDLSGADVIEALTMEVDDLVDQPKPPRRRRKVLRGEWGDPLMRMGDAEATLRLLIEARDAARAAGAVQTLARIQSAISSAKGAVRNATGRFYEWKRTHTQEAPPS